jgi:hypothetical protein
MVSGLASSVVDRGFELRSGQTMKLVFVVKGGYLMYVICCEGWLSNVCNLL